jgi:rhodanese-related sulfurtransferase
MSRLPKTAEGVDVVVARAVWAAGDTVLDVRTPDEYALGHLPGAVNLPIDRLAPAAGALPPGQVLTTCSAGLRAERAAHRLAALGRDALWIRGGIKAWRAAGLPVVTGPAAGERPAPGRRRLSGLFRALIGKG